jgi:hypothetical protein
VEPPFPGPLPPGLLLGEGNGVTPGAVGVPGSAGLPGVLGSVGFAGVVPAAGDGALVEGGGALVVVVDPVVVGGVAAVTVKVCGLYSVTSDGRPSVKHAAATDAISGCAFAGTVNEPCHVPFAATGMLTFAVSVGDETLT